MVFSTNVFLFIFLPIVLLGYYIINEKYRNVFLLLASLFFYFWGEPRFVFVMIASIVFNYIGGLVISITSHKTKVVRSLVLFLFLLLNLGMLVVYKYLDFLIETFNWVVGTEIDLLKLALPIGISFFTFQGVSYLIDVYRGDVEAQKNPFSLGLYISMFPQLIAGPIVRYIDIEKEIKSRTINLEIFSTGVERFIIGLAKKVILSNRLAVVVDDIFAVPAINNSCGTAWLGVICYAFQLYFDFSGYSDMAIGLGKMFGFNFFENFNFPYISKSISEFWRRWHISLSSWFRDYLYIPLGGNRRGCVYVNLFIVFICTGLWHGASLNFLVWGIWHGIFMIIERLLRKKKTEQEKGNVLRRLVIAGLKHIYTIMVVLIGWVFFRANDLEYAWEYLKVMLGFGQGEPWYNVEYYLDGFLCFVLVMSIVVSIGLLYRIVPKKPLKSKWTNTIALCIRGVWLIGILLISLMFVINSTYNPFIYFRF